MKKIIGIIILSILLSSTSFAGVVGAYKNGKGALKISKNTANILEYYFSKGKKGAYAKKQKENWIGELFVISVDGNYYSWFNTPVRYQSSVAPGHYTGRAISDCKKKSGQECYLFATRNKIVWDNGSDKKKRRLKRKDIKAGKTIALLTELGFYDGSTSSATITPKVIEKKEPKIKKKIVNTKESVNDKDIVKKLKDLKELLDTGVLSKEEFKKAKKKLLN